MPVLALGVSHHQASADQLIRFAACGKQALDELRALYPQTRFEQAAPLGDADSIVQAMAAHVLTLARE